MKIFFETRNEARDYTKGNPNCKMFDSKDKPFNGTLRWGVKITK